MAEKVSTIQKSFFNDNINGIFLVKIKFLRYIFDFFIDKQELSQIEIELDDACKLLEQYQKNLEEDISRRNHLIHLLNENIKIQENKINLSNSYKKVFFII